MTTGLTLHIDRFRRRARLVVLVRDMCTATALAMLAVVAWRLAAAPPAGAALPIAGGVLAAGLAAAIASGFRTPTVRMTAAAIDRRLRLQDRMIAALDVSGDTDAMSQLVVHDAILRLESARPADVFPLTVGRQAAAAAGAVVLALVISGADGADGAFGALGAGATGAAGAAGATGAAGAAGAETASSTGDGANAETASPMSDRTNAEAAAAAGDSVNAASPPRDGGPQSASPNRDSAKAGPTDTTGALGALGALGAEGALGAGAAGLPAVARSAKAGATGTEPDSAKAGGVAGAVVVGTSLASSPTAASAAAVARAGSAADAAIARDDIPPARRQYVRDYFLSLRPPGFQ